MSNKKQVLEFQARCLSLLEIFLSRCYDNIALVLDLPLPLLTIIEQASVDQRKANIAERASVILRWVQLKNNVIACFFLTLSFVNWMCSLLRLLRKMVIEVGSGKVAKQSSTYRQKN